jgi:hypothetical protein
MNYYQLMIISNCSIFLPLFLCLWNLKEIRSPRYLPFLCFILAFSVNEIISLAALSFIPDKKMLNCDIYFLVESILLFWLFKRWGLFEGKSKAFNAIPIIYLVVWILEENYRGFSAYLPLFIILYAFVAVIMSINMMSRTLLNELTKITYNPIFTISCTFLVFFIYTILHVVFWLPGLNTDYEFKWKVFTIFNLINIVSNFGYAIAVVQIRKRRKFQLI